MKWVSEKSHVRLDYRRILLLTSSLREGTHLFTSVSQHLVVFAGVYKWIGKNKENWGMNVRLRILGLFFRQRKPFKDFEGEGRYMRTLWGSVRTVTSWQLRPPLWNKWSCTCLSFPEEGSLDRGNHMSKDLMRKSSCKGSVVLLMRFLLIWPS